MNFLAKRHDGRQIPRKLTEFEKLFNIPQSGTMDRVWGDEDIKYIKKTSVTDGISKEKV